MEKSVVIVGLGTSGIYAARTISSLQRDGEIVIFEKRPYPTYSPCGMPYAIGGEAPMEALKHPYPQTRRIHLHLGYEVREIDTVGKVVRASKVGGNDYVEVEYSSLIYCGGGSPFIPPIKGVDTCKEHIHVLRRIEDAEVIQDRAKTINNNGGGRVVVVGGGAIGLEVATALKDRWPGIGVSVVEIMDQIMPSLDRDMADLVKSHIESKGVKVMVGRRVESLTPSEQGNGVALALDDGSSIEAHMVIMSTGVRPETALLHGKVEMERGFIKVDRHMRTSDESIYAAGDCVIGENYLHVPMPAQYATAAMKQGIVAGMNVAGINAEYTGATYTVTSVIGGMEVASCGINTTQAGKHGIEVVGMRVKHHSKPEWLGGAEMVIKILFTKSGELIGAQALGPGATREINVASAVLRSGGGLEDLLSIEEAYCPAVSELQSPLQLAVEMGLKRIKYLQGAERVRI